MRIHVFETAHDLARAATDWLIDSIYYVLQERSRFNLALSAGPAAEAVYRLLATPPYCDRVQWGKLHLYWCHESAVSPSHAASAYGRIERILLDHIFIPASNLHRIEGELGAAAAAAEAYQQQLAAAIGTPPRFDLMLMDVGEPAIRAVYASAPAIGSGEAATIVLPARQGSPPVLALHPSTLDAAGEVLVLATGGQAAGIVRNALVVAEASGPLLAAAVPHSRARAWLLDAAAASRLPDWQSYLSRPKALDFNE